MFQIINYLDRDKIRQINWTNGKNMYRWLEAPKIPCGTVTAKSANIFFMNEKSNKEGKTVKICPRAIVTSTPLFLVHKHLCLLQKHLRGCFLIWFAKFCCLTSLFLQISKWIPFAVQFFSETRNIYARLLLLPLPLRITRCRNSVSQEYAAVARCSVHVERCGRARLRHVPC